MAERAGCTPEIAPDETSRSEGAQALASDKRPEVIAGMFDAIAARYDLLNHVLSAGVDRYWRYRAIRALALTGRETVLDLCTGTADLAVAAVTPRAPRAAARVVGVDFSGEMLRMGRVKLRRRALDRQVILVRGDAERVPLAGGSVARVTVAFGIRNVHHPHRALAEAFRVLAPGGRLALLEFSMPRSRPLRAVYGWYFRRILPRIGRLVSGHRKAYTYLPASVGAFVPPSEFVADLERTGFRSVVARPLTFGVVQLYVADKPARDVAIPGGAAAGQEAGMGARHDPVTHSPHARRGSDVRSADPAGRGRLVPGWRTCYNRVSY